MQVLCLAAAKLCCVVVVVVVDGGAGAAVIYAFTSLIDFVAFVQDLVRFEVGKRGVSEKRYDACM